MTTPARLEVDHFIGDARRVTVRYFDLDVPDEIRAVLQPMLDDTLDQLVAETGMHRSDAAAWLMCEVAERSADAEAYEREAERRGFLPL